MNGKPWRAALALLALAGCASYRVPSYEPRDHALNRAAELADELETAGLSVRVAGALADVPPDAPSLELDTLVGPCFAEPMLYVLTVGVIPHVGCERFGQRFLLRRAPDAEPVRVDAVYEAGIVVGWIAPVLNLMPSRTSEIPPDAERRAVLGPIARELASAP